MKLSRDEPGMIPKLDNFYQSSIGRKPAQNEPLVCQCLAVRIVKFIPVTMALSYLHYAVCFVCQASLRDSAGIGTKPHGPAFLTHRTLIRHEVDDGMRRLRIEFRAIGLFQSGDVSSEFNNR